MKYLKIIFLSTLAISLFGCAHPIVISPDLAKIERESNSLPRIKATVGFFIPVDAISLEVTTPGGGGDNVRYFPYKDLEAGYRHMLSNVFDNVVRLTSLNDSDEIAKNAIRFILSPDLITNSGSTGFFTWPPTNFTVDLTTNIRDVTKKSVDSPRVVGNGQSTGSLEEFRLDGFGIAGRRAMEDALLKTQHILLETKYDGISEPSTFSVISSPPSNTSSHQLQNSPSEKLENLKNIFNGGLITKTEYERKRKEILDRF